jgi:hypothetical protein
LLISTFVCLLAKIDGMSTLQLRRQAKALIDGLSSSQLRAANEFLAFVKNRDLDPATRELLSIPGFDASFARGMKDIRAGRTKPWRDIAHRKARSNV